jgi:hypothetical protein
VIGTRHHGLTAERLDRVGDALIVGGDEAAVYPPGGHHLLIYVLNQELAGLMSERFPGEACRAEAGRYDGNDLHKVIPSAES